MEEDARSNNPPELVVASDTSSEGNGSAAESSTARLVVTDEAAPTPMPGVSGRAARTELEDGRVATDEAVELDEVAA